MMQAKSLAQPTIQQGNKKLNEKRIHECHKPIMLYQAIYKELLLPGDNIYDSHVGSGSSRIAADVYGCGFVGSEIDPKHWAAAEKRYAIHKSRLTLPYAHS